MVTIIPTNLVTNTLLSLFCPFVKTKKKKKIKFSTSWWSGNENYFCFLFIATLAPLQRYSEFNRIL